MMPRHDRGTVLLACRSGGVPCDDILQEDSRLFRFKNHTREERLAHNAKCGGCDYSRICSSGSPCMSLLLHGDMLALDDTACDFYESGMYEQVLSLAGFGVRDAEE